MQKTYRTEPTSGEMIGSALRLAGGTADKLTTVDSRLELVEKRLRGDSHDSPWRSFGEFLQSVRRAADGNVEKRLKESRAASGLNESGAPDEGGFLIPMEFSSALAEMVHYAAPLASRCLRIPAKQPAIALPAIDELSRAEGSRWGGVRSYWASEAETVTATKPKFRRMQLSLHKLTALVWTTDELTDDADALGTFVSNAFRAEAAYVLDSMISAGNGAGQPLGILNAPALITVAKDASQAAATISATNVAGMLSRLLPECFDTAVWIVSPELFGALFLAPLVLGGTSFPNPLFTKPDADAPRGRLMTLPIVVSETASAIGSVGDIILASLPHYVVYEKPVAIALSIHVRFLNGEGIYRFSYRVDGAPILKTPITPKNGGSTKSAFVTLAERA